MIKLKILFFFVVYTQEELDEILDRSDLLEQHKNTLAELAKSKNSKK